MRPAIIRFACLLAILECGFGCRDAGKSATEAVGGESVDVPRAQVCLQDASNLCWAAGVQCCLAAQGADVSQWDIVRRRYGHPIDEASGSLKDLAEKMDGWEIRGNRTVTFEAFAGPPDEQSLVTELSGGRPVLCAGFLRDNGAPHVTVIVGASIHRDSDGAPHVISVKYVDPMLASFQNAPYRNLLPCLEHLKIEVQKP